MNKKAFDEGLRSFSCELTFIESDKQYQLFRECTIEKSGPRVSAVMSVEGKPVPQDELSTIVRKIVPEDTSRFFLFDGEILQEYQNLLDIDSKTSKRISQAIEDVLGVPALTQLTRELPGAIKRLRTKTQAELQKQQASDTFPRN